MTGNTLDPKIAQALRMTTTPSTDEVSRFLDAAAAFAPRVAAFCQVLAWTGCRLSEAIQITPGRIDSHRHFIVFETLKQRAKAGSPPRYRIVPVPAHVIQMLLELPRGQGERLFPFSRWTGYRYVRRVMFRAGVTGTCATPKALRHRYNASAIMAGVPDQVRMELLGHRKLQSNLHYGELAAMELRVHAERIWADGQDDLRQ